MMKTRYNHLNEYLKNKFGERVLKICVDGGFTCPNRDGSKGYGGCIFCGEDGAGENIKGKCLNHIESIKNQIETFINSYRGYRANKFIVYFQSFSSTYDTMDNLKLKYDTALRVSNKIIGIEIATRPDLITPEVVALLKTYKQRYYVCVELGLQTANNEIGELINRKYSTEDFENACRLLSEQGIDIVGHLMVGLPQEKPNDIMNTVHLINRNCNGIKIHSTFVQKDTELAKLYNTGNYKPITLEYYVMQVCNIIAGLNKSIIVHRINADPPKDKLVAPDWMLRKKIILNTINNELEKRNISQGDNII